MPIETHVDHAQTRVRAERETTTSKLDAIETFRDRVDEAPSETAGRTRSLPPDGGGIQSLSAGVTPDGCRAVRRAFDETIRPYSDVADDAQLLEAIRTELSDAIAAALAPNTSVTLTPTLVRAIDAEAEARRRETDLLLDVLDREATALADAASVVEEVTDWLVEADQTRLSSLDFAALRERHEALADRRECCETLARERQAFLGDVTSDDGERALRHRDLRSHLYADFPVDHPVLVTAVRLADVCETSQRAVRDHLVRRA